MRWVLLLMVCLACIVVIGSSTVLAETETELELEYVLYNLSTRDDNSTILKIIEMNVSNWDSVHSQLNTTHGPIHSYGPNWICVRNVTALFSFWAYVKDENASSGRSPMTNASLSLRFLDGHNGDISRPPVKDIDGNKYIFHGSTDDTGYGEIEITFPSQLAFYQLVPAFHLDPDPSDPLFIESGVCDLMVVPPPTITITDLTSRWELEPNEPYQLMTIVGCVEYIYTNHGVEGAFITVQVYGDNTSNLVGGAEGSSDQDGRFGLTFSFPTEPYDHLRLEVKATDPRTGESDDKSLPSVYIGDGDDVEENGQELSWSWQMTIIVGIFGSILIFIVALFIARSLRVER